MYKYKNRYKKISICDKFKENNIINESSTCHKRHVGPGNQQSAIKVHDLDKLANSQILRYSPASARSTARSNARRMLLSADYRRAPSTLSTRLNVWGSLLKASRCPGRRRKQTRGLSLSTNTTIPILSPGCKPVSTVASASSRRRCDP